MIKMKDKNVIFMGTPDFAVPILKTLIKNTNVIMVVTQPDKETGRKRILTPSPIKKVAIENNIPVYQPAKIRLENEEILKTKPDLIVTCAYGQIIPKVILDLPKYGCINVHASILPKLRGGAPIHHAIIRGEDKTGITIMYMDEGMDTGDIIKIEECIIESNDNVGTLHDKLSKIGSSLLEEVLPTIFNNTNQRIKQNNELATFAPTIKREDEKIDFNNCGKDIINQIRGLNPWPVANFLLNNQEIKVFEAKFEPANNSKVGIIKEISKNNFVITCKDGDIYLTKIKPMGKNIMDIKDYLNGINKEEILKEGRINNDK